MKTVLLFSILFCGIAMPSFAELTDADLDKIRLIVKEEVKTEVTSSEARMKQYVDLKIESVNGRLAGIEGRFTGIEGRFTGIEGRFIGIEGRFTGMEKQLATLTYLVYALIAPIVMAVGIPQVIMTLRDNSNRDRDRKIETLTKEIETLKQQRIANP